MLHSSIRSGDHWLRNVNVYNDEPLFIQDPGSWSRRPNSVTAIDNFFLAGEWVKTDQNVTTMEGANEGGRQAANGLLEAAGYRGPRAAVVGLFQAPWWEPFKAADRARYRAKLPNVLDVVDADGRHDQKLVGASTSGYFVPISRHGSA